MKFMVERDGGVVGPYELDELKERLESNYFSLSDVACEHTGGRWIPLSEMFRMKPELEKTAKTGLLERLKSKVAAARER